MKEQAEKLCLLTYVVAADYSQKGKKNRKCISITGSDKNFVA